jgi:hypothetical protein
MLRPVLCQLSYAPRFEQSILVAAFGHDPGVAEHEQQTDEAEREEFERREGDLLEREQEHKGYGEDEGERDESLRDE